MDLKTPKGPSIYQKHKQTKSAKKREPLPTRLRLWVTQLAPLPTLQVFTKIWRGQVDQSHQKAFFPACIYPHNVYIYTHTGIENQLRMYWKAFLSIGGPLHMLTVSRSRWSKGLTPSNGSLASAWLRLQRWSHSTSQSWKSSVKDSC